MVFFLVLTILAYALLIKAPFLLKRSLADACLELVEEEKNSSIYSKSEGRYKHTHEREEEGVEGEE